MKINRKLFVCVLIFVFLPTLLFAQIRVSGFVSDALSGERLVGANLIDLTTRRGCITNEQGYFSMQVKTPVELQFSFVGYTPQTFTIQSTKDTLVDLFLTEGKSIKGVEVRTNYRSSSNRVTLNTRQIMNMPSLTGKPDVLKAMQMMPGIRSQGEASSVTLVRGGNPGENLYLLDQTPLIYVHHLGGFMSVFNPDIINNVDIYKGAFPPQYGERLSSIMNITQKEGDKSGLQGSFSIGIADLAFTLEGPTKLKNSSFIFTARKTLIELYLMLFSSMTDQNTAILSYGFHDLNGKYSWRPNQKNSFHLNFYQGDDYLKHYSKSGESKNAKFRLGNTWGNWLLSTNWKHIYSSNLFFNTTLSYTYYRLKNTEKVAITDGQDEVFKKNRKERSSLQDVSLRSDARYLVSKNWDIDFGLKMSWLQFNPVNIKNWRGENFKEVINALESAVYFDNKIQILDPLNLNVGLRLVNYSTYDFSHLSLEPRASLNLSLGAYFGLNTTYMRVSQNAQLAYKSGSIAATEIYLPSGKDIPVSTSDQLTFGFTFNFLDKMYDAEANVYYKRLHNLSTYREGYHYSTGDINWKNKIETGGSGIAKGFEFLFKKNQGDFTGFVAYTYANSTRKYANMNQGNSYVFEYDSPHTIALSLNYQLSKKWSLSATWQYQTGLPYTPVIGRYVAVDLDGQTGASKYYEVFVYGEKNSARMRDYHRLDLGAKYTTISKKRNRKAEWTFSIYNVYSRQNPYYYYYNTSISEEVYNPRYWDKYYPVDLYQISMFPFLPMISYKVWFGANSGQNEREKKRFLKWLFYE